MKNKIKCLDCEWKGSKEEIFSFLSEETEKMWTPDKKNSWSWIEINRETKNTLNCCPSCFSTHIEKEKEIKHGKENSLFNL